MTVLDLLDPEVWEQISHEAHADLFVSWDALALPRMGADLLAVANGICERPQEDTANTVWWNVIDQETALWNHVAHLPKSVVQRVAPEVARVLLAPVLHAIQEDPRHPQLIACSVHPNWPTWAEELEGADAQCRRGEAPTERRGVIFVLDGIYGRNTGGSHHIPLFRYTTWEEVLSVIQWIVLMAWLSELQGECG